MVNSLTQGFLTCGKVEKIENVCVSRIPLMPIYGSKDRVGASIQILGGQMSKKLVGETLFSLVFPNNSLRSFRPLKGFLKGLNLDAYIAYGKRCKDTEQFT